MKVRLIATVLLVLGISGCSSVNKVFDSIGFGSKSAPAHDSEHDDDTSGSLDNNLSGERLRSLSLQVTQQLDMRERLAPASSEYNKRLQRLTQSHRYDSGMNLNFRAYLSDDVNIIGLADGSVRVFSGLMDLMNDNELRSLIAHQMAHIKLGHSRSALRWANGLLVAKKSTKARRDISDIDFILNKLLNAKYSHEQEQAADDDSLGFLSQNNYDLYASVSALRKLTLLGAEAKVISNHSKAELRAQRMEASIEKGIKFKPQKLQYAQQIKKEKEILPVRKPTTKVSAAQVERVEPPVKVTKTPIEAVKKRTKKGVMAEARVAPGFYIQVAADNTQTEATNRAKKLQDLNARAVIQEVVVNGRTFFRVLVGPYLEEPTEQLTMLQKHNYQIAKGTPFVKHFK